ncbi:MAG: glycosyltransferase [Rudaea sp.]
MPRPAVTLICTVKNEATSLPRLLDSLLAQTCRPQQVVIADGGSTDETRRVIEQYRSRVELLLLDCPGANISQGRNAAIAQAAGPVIASTDAGVRLDPHWLEELVRPFEAPQPPDVVSGFFLPDPQGAFETALAATTLPAERDIRPARFLPSSRSVAFRKSAWQQAGRYPEWLDYSEDLVFDLALRDAGLKFVFAPAARVYFRPRSNLRQFARQYYLYARGDGKANLWFKRHMVRYLTYLGALPLSVVIFIGAPWAGLLIWAAACIIMFATPYRRLLDLWIPLGLPARLVSLALVPVIRIIGDVAKMAGYPVGVRWRFNRGRARSE